MRHPIKKGKQINHRPKSRFRTKGEKRHGRGSGPDPAMAGALLALLREAGRPLAPAEIMAALAAGPHERKEVLRVLAGLELERLVGRTRDKRFQALARTGDTVEGTIELHPSGHGLVRTGPGKGGRAGGQELFVPSRALASARHGDLVLVEKTGARDRRGQGEKARVVQVLERGATEVVGTYFTAGSTGFVEPEDPRLHLSVMVRREDSLGARNGEAVVAALVERPGLINPEGRIIKVLGAPEDLGVQTEIVVRKHGLPSAFTAEAIEEAERLDRDPADGPARADLRNILHVTIDGETARDFDDAVAVRKTRSGYRLYVSIADVSHYVRPGTQLDREAYERGTSVYFPSRVLPMLPERLSNDLCSLVPDQDRPAFTAILDFDRDGRLQAKELTKSLIRSKARLTYTAVRQIVADRDEAVRSAHQELLKPLRWMADLALLLERLRLARGSIGFDLPEPEVTLTQAGEVAGIGLLERNQAHKIIEEFMLAANEAVAETLAEAGIPTLYRIHEVPDPQRVTEFQEFARILGLALPGDIGTPRWFGKVLELVKKTAKEYIVNNLLLRTMKRARYCPDNVGHFGLAAAYYTHFTSPIRRYPDLMVHRALGRLLAGERTDPEPTAGGRGSLAEQGDFLSERERAALEAEREMIDRLRVLFMQDKVGETFDGVISGCAPFGFFVELIGLYVSGAVAVTDLKDDYYLFDEKQHRFFGRGSHRVFQLGDPVRVTLKSVDPRRRWINFVLAEP